MGQLSDENINEALDIVEQTFRGRKYYHNPRFGTAIYLKIEFSPKGIQAELPEDLRGEFLTRYELALDTARASGKLDELDQVMHEWFMRAASFRHLGPNWETEQEALIDGVEKLATKQNAAEE